MPGAFFRYIPFCICLLCAPLHAEIISGDNNSRHYLVISFYSECCGIDQPAQDNIDKWLTEFQKLENIRLQQKKIYWGKEGEEDYCIRTENLSEEQLNQLKKGIIAVKGNSRLTGIEATTRCREQKQ